jgi:hypothetical protein
VSLNLLGNNQKNMTHKANTSEMMENTVNNEKWLCVMNTDIMKEHVGLFSQSGIQPCYINK